MTELVENTKKKVSVNEYHEQIFEGFSQLEELDLELKNLKLEYFEKEKQVLKKKIKLNKEINFIKKKLESQFNREINIAKKEKRKRKIPVNGGIMKVIKVPKVICKYTGLEDTDDLKMTRPQLVRLLNEQFKKDGSRQGQDIILNKKTAKLFGKKVNKNNTYVIPFKGFQTFITEILSMDEVSDDSKKKKNKNKKVSIVV